MAGRVVLLDGPTLLALVEPKPSAQIEDLAYPILKLAGSGDRNEANVLVDDANEVLLGARCAVVAHRSGVVVLAIIVRVGLFLAAAAGTTDVSTIFARPQGNLLNCHWQVNNFPYSKSMTAFKTSK